MPSHYLADNAKNCDTVFICSALVLQEHVLSMRVFLGCFLVFFLDGAHLRIRFLCLPDNICCTVLSRFGPDKSSTNARKRHSF